MPDAAVLPASTAEIRMLEAVQQRLAARPGVLVTARALSHFGEHALGWLALAGLGAALDRPRRARWYGAAFATAGAHGASIVVKRVIRRPRPDHPSVIVGVGTPSRLSFPSSHAASTAAATLAIGRLTGLPLLAVLLPPMLVSRMVLGVHYPSDVLAGAALGVAAATIVARRQDRSEPAGGSR